MKTMKNELKTKKPFKVLKNLVPLFYNLAIATTGLAIVSSALGATFAEEIRIRLFEFKLMGIIEIEKWDKGNKIIEYHKIRGIKKYIKGFLKRNPKWKSEEEISFNIKTGRIILTRVYRKYNKKQAEIEYCSECGHELNDEYDD